ncbi:MAG TPA: histidine kinase [Puia sp.]|uniref:sensor histidine kinase n=1 Tax=Puia sp. TaxID=2045100 RepID=UPI002BDE02A0|nr:histidine kinase [Puia sp.]HVU94233.1 histidine kinase [Puia sp.]
MQRLPFLYSDIWTWRLARHLSFWVVASLGLGLLGLGIRPLFGVEISPGAFKEHVLQPLLYLPGQVFLVYTLLYWVIPRFLLQSKYRQAALWAVVLTVLGGFIAAIADILLHNSLYEWVTNRNISVVMKNGKVVNFPLAQQENLWQSLPYGFLFALRAILNVAGAAAALKLAKHWYEKEYLNSVLQRERLDAELQSLKAQLHPHFLFNTLNNIYSATESTSPVASGMLVQLSALLRYILYECDRPLVLLSKELTLIRDYIELERVRYGSLELNTRLPAETNGYAIAPLLLLPLVENCFKHGTSQMMDQPWVSIEAEVDGGRLAVKLINGKLPGGELFSEGIGLTNVRKRLDLLYPDRHELSILSEPDLFIVNLKLELVNINAAHG